MNPAWLAAAAWVLLTPAAGAAPLCRWVDDQGRTQLSDVVPDKYKAEARCTDSQRYELTPEQREQARARNATRAKPPAARASEPPRAASAASQPVAKRPAERVTDATDCTTWWHLFDESEACFGPYRTTRGGIKPEAFDACNEVASPELSCGPRRR